MVAVAEYYIINGTFPSLNSAAGLPGRISGKYVLSVVVGDTRIAGEPPTIQITLSGAVQEKLLGGVIELIPVDHGGSIEFICRSGGRDITAYLLSSCKEN